MRFVRGSSTVVVGACFVAMLAGLLAACGGGGESSGSGKSESDEKSPLTIGLANAQTGFFAAYDSPLSDGVKIAVNKINKSGGIDGRSVKVISADAKSDPNTGAVAAREVIEDGAEFVITMCDYDLGAPAARVANEQGKLALSCAGSPLFGTLGIGPLAFTSNEGAPTSGTAGAEFATSKGWKTAYVLEDTAFEFSKSWCDAFKQEFTKLNGSEAILGEDSYEFEDSSLATQVSRLRSSAPDTQVVAICGFPPTGALAVRELRAAGIDAPIVTTSGFDGPFWLEAVPNASEVYSVTPASVFGDDPSAAINEFVAEYTKAHGAPENSYAVMGPALVEMIEQAVTEVGTTEGAALAHAMSKWTDKPLLLGPTTYTENCHMALGRPPRIVEFSNGTGHYVTTVTPKEVPVPAECK